MIHVSVRHDHVAQVGAAGVKRLGECFKVTAVADARIDQHGRTVRPNQQVGVIARPGHRARDHFLAGCVGAPMATGRIAEPAAPFSRSGRIMVHDSHVRSFAISSSLRFSTR